MEYTTRIVGAPNTFDYRVFIEDKATGTVLSPFHDIPLWANEQKTILNMVVEVPRWTNAKMEISKNESMNPILQDTKKGKLRFVRNCFPHHGYIWNCQYFMTNSLAKTVLISGKSSADGAFPQTWEDPKSAHAETKAYGDNDPLDVCEIGEAVGYTGQIKQVKVLGIMALLDEGETDWKILAIDVNDPLAGKLNDIEDVERHLPGLIRATNEWFRIYKIPDGKPENQFAFSGEAKNKKYAIEIIHECSEAWKKLVAGVGDHTSHKISIANTSLKNSSAHITQDSSAYRALPEARPEPAASIDGSIAKWFYISGSSA
ncbi:MAG: Inorganic pyrophosphatase [Cyphobasidiales sp. Tagirdzhanova-0007]|nr:MAG: Inorganic pyrophosphatase [Cyphobasidiales sp. Tagirdzhanova-0007]